jgi:hypothetical protein
MSETRIIPTYASAVTPEFDRDETPHWTGQPRQGLYLRGSDAFAIPFSLVFLGFALFWTFGAMRGRAPLPIMKFAGVPFVLLGLYFAIGRFFHERWRRSNTFYAVTDKRIVIVEQLFSRTVTSVALHTLPEVSLMNHRDGTATIRLGKALVARDWLGFTPNREHEQLAANTLERIPDGRPVYELIRRLQKQIVKKPQSAEH